MFECKYYNMLKGGLSMILSYFTIKSSMCIKKRHNESDRFYKINKTGLNVVSFFGKYAFAI